MAKKDLSQAPGLDALFRRPTIQSEETTTTVAPEPKEEEKGKTEKKEKEPSPTSHIAKDPPKKKSPGKEETTQQKSKESAPKKKAAPAKKNNVFSVNLEAIRKNEVKYTGIRLKKDLFDRLGKIAEKEKVKSTNSLISKVLEAFCEGYEGA